MRAALLLVPTALLACATPQPSASRSPASTGAVREVGLTDPERRAVEAQLDAWHAAAAAADTGGYFSRMAPGAIFLGTDATERWDRAAFEAYVAPHFSAGRGWTYTVRERHVFLSPDHQTAWFDEDLHNDKYGQCRGSGVMTRVSGIWRVAHYNLTIPVPNELAAEVVERIRSESEKAGR